MGVLAVLETTYEAPPPKGGRVGVVVLFISSDGARGEGLHVEVEVIGCPIFQNFSTED
jgi:hypothetical protein